MHGFQRVAFGHQQRCQDHVAAGEVGDDVTELRRSFETSDAHIFEPAAAGEAFGMPDGSACLAADAVDRDDQSRADRRPVSGWCLHRG